MVTWARAAGVGLKRRMTRFIGIGNDGTRVLSNIFFWIRSRKIQWYLGENKKSREVILFDVILKMKVLEYTCHEKCLLLGIGSQNQ